LDQLYGASYNIDLTKPVGSRIVNLEYNGKPISNTDVFTVAINDYRYNGGGGFMKEAGLSNTDPSIVTYSSAKTLGDDGQIRSLMISYIKSSKIINPTCSNNWKLSTKNASIDNSESSNLNTWKLVNNQWYYLNTDGTMKTGWLLDKDDQWYYLDTNGAMKTGWVQNSDGNWYYLEENGVMAKNKVINGYVLNETGEWVA